MKLKNKVALVTGGSEGLGFSIAKNLISKGVKVTICARTEKNLDIAKKKINSDNLKTIKCDVANYEQVEKMFKQLGQVDILINAAGVWFNGQLEEHSKEQIDLQIDINLKGTVYTCKQAVALMKKENNGYIVNVSSTSGLKGQSNRCVYVASKFGVRGLTDSLKIDLKDTNIKVVGFYPGGMNTNLFKHSKNKVDTSKLMDPNKVAEIVVFAIERDESMIMDHVVVNRRNK